ncbi:TetR family transcriptional regulator C-terminal domain-containing protein, partial [Vibrio sinaloensis]
QLKRLQSVNEKRLLSHLKLELKGLFDPQQAELIAFGIASLIDGIWLRGTLNPSGIDATKARFIINDYLDKQLTFYSKK